MVPYYLFLYYPDKKGRLERTPVLASDAGGVDLHNLVNKTWHVYQVTPLSEFKQDAANLKKYSRHLSAFLQAVSNTHTTPWSNNNIIIKETAI